MRTAHTVTARKPFRCHGYRCSYAIQPGEDYARHVAFPGDEVNDGPVPRVLKICEVCQTEHGAPMPPRPTRRTTGTAPVDQETSVRPPSNHQEPPK